EASTITFGVQLPDKLKYNTLASNKPRFFPVVRKAELTIPAIKHLVGNTKTCEVEYAPLFLQYAFNTDQNKNVSEAFLQILAGKEIDLDSNQQGDKSGGLVKPNMKVSGLSRKLGPVSGANAIKNVAAGAFDPADFFGSFDGIKAKIFGVID